MVGTTDAKAWAMKSTVAVAMIVLIATIGRGGNVLRSEGRHLGQVHDRPIEG
jgi:hypothetical protein